MLRIGLLKSLNPSDLNTSTVQMDESSLPLPGLLMFLEGVLQTI